VRQGIQRQNFRLLDNPEVGQGEVAGNAGYLARAVPIPDDLRQRFTDFQQGKLDHPRRLA